MALTTVLLAILAGWGLLALALYDSLTARPRRWVFSRLDPDGPTWRLLTCPWCAGFWVMLPVAGSAALWGNEAWWQAGALAIGGRMLVAAGMVTWTPPDDDP